MLGTVVGAVVSGRVPVGNAEGDVISSWLNPTSIMIGVVAVTLCAYLAAVYLAADADRKSDSDLADAFRTRGLVAGVVTGVVAAVGVIVLRDDSTLVYDGLTSGLGLVDLVASAAAGVATIALLASRRYRAARYTAAAAVVTIVAGWGIAQSPYILPPDLTVAEAAASDDVLIALMVAIAIGLLVLVPSLMLLYGLVLGGRFDPGQPGGAVVDEAQFSEAGSPSTAAAPDPPKRSSVAIALVMAAVGTTLAMVFDSGAWLYIGIAMVIGALIAGCVLLAFSVLNETEKAEAG
jgi:cytochrome d ubiquinol oxidase subunit II